MKTTETVSYITIGCDAVTQRRSLELRGFINPCPSLVCLSNLFALLAPNEIKRSQKKRHNRNSDGNFLERFNQFCEAHMFVTLNVRSWHTADLWLRKVRCVRKVEVKWLDVSIDLYRSNPMRQLYICQMLFLNDKRQAVTSSGNGHIQLVSRFLRFIFIEHAKVAT